MKLEKELLSISARKKFDSNSSTKEIKYSRKTDFKKFSPLGITKSEKFVFEDDVSLKPNFKLSSNFVSNYENYNDYETNKNLKYNNNNNINEDNCNNKKSNLKKKKEDSLQALLANHKKVNFEDEKQKKLDEENKNMHREFNASKDKLNNIKAYSKNMNNYFINNNNNLKNLDLLTYDDSKKINFDNNSNIQGVNKLSSNKLSIKDYYNNCLKENKKNNTTEDKAQEKARTTVNFYKPNSRSKSITSFEKSEDPKAFLLGLFESKKDSRKTENESDKLNKSNNEEFTSKQKLFILESDFNCVFNRTKKSISFKNNLFEKVEKIKISKGLNYNNNNIITKQENKFDGDLNNNNFNKKNDSSKDSKFNSRKSLNAILANNPCGKTNQKIFEKINDLNFDFNLTDKLNKTNSKPLNFKSVLLNQEITFSENNKEDESNITKIINNLNNISLPAKNKISEINSLADNLSGLREKNKKLESEQLIKNNRKISIEDSKQELEENVYKSIYLKKIIFVCLFVELYFCF